MRLVLFLALCQLTFFLAAQDGNFTFGARQNGMGGTSATLTDGYAVFNNAGGIGNLDNSEAFAGYELRYATAAFQTFAGGYMQHTKWGNVGINFYRFGDQLYNQQRAGITLGNRLQMVSLGASLHYVQYHVESQETRGNVLVDLGGIVEIMPQLHFGAFVANINQPNLGPNQNVPVLMRAGLSYRPLSSLMINAEVEKIVDSQEVLKVGLEYQVHQVFTLRSGFSTQSDKIAIGFGISPASFNIDYAYTNQTDVGGIHQLSLRYRIQANE